ncbi:MAG TPA: hypothetical protein VKI44_09165 [Acetobacteraceae bacterium]|nr:hypothetical protein [Acetobacteraceae bacterium]
MIWSAEFIAEHRESLSRGVDDRPFSRARLSGEVKAIKARWGERLQRDPFYSPHFALSGRPFFDLAEVKQPVDGRDKSRPSH